MRISQWWMVALVVGVVACSGGNKKVEPPVGNGSGSADPVAKAPPKPATKFSVELVSGTTAAQGAIRDSATKEPLIGVTVIVTSPALQGSQAAITDETGKFNYATLPPGSYTLTAYYSDQTTAGEFTVEGGKTASITLDWDVTAKNEIVEIAAREPDFKTAIEALKHGALALTIKLGELEVKKKPSSQLHAMLAIARWGFAVESFRFEALATGGNSKTAKDFKNAMANFATELEIVQKHLAEAAKDPTFAFELCVACMAGEDTFLALVSPGAFDIERDKGGKELGENDPKRRPTYRFDQGDLAWARAITHFQQAVTEVTLAYDWEWIDALMAEDDTDKPMPTKFTIKLLDAKRIEKAREHILAGLAASDESRVAFLAETDDDREWVPNPTQKSFASPLPVDAALYKTWEGIIGDVRQLVNGENGVSLKALWSAFGMRREAPAGFIDIGAMLKTPTDITFEIGSLDRIENEKNAGKRGKLTTDVLKGLLGNGYKAKMKASRLTDRLIRLRKDLDGAGNEFEDKMKYFIWLN